MPTLIHQWKMNANTNDSVGSANLSVDNGTLVAGLISNALRLQKATDGAIASAGSGDLVAAGNSFTLAFWIKFNVADDSSFKFHFSDPTDFYWQNIFFTESRVGSNSDTIFGGTGAEVTADGNYHLVAIVCNVDTGGLYYYLDNTLIGNVNTEEHGPPSVNAASFYTEYGGSNCDVLIDNIMLFSGAADETFLGTLWHSGSGTENMPPGDVTDFAANDTADGAVCTWTDPSNGGATMTGAIAWYDADDSSFIDGHEFAPGSTPGTYTITGLTAGNYYANVSFSNSVGGGNGNNATFTVEASTSVPDAPTLTITSAGNHSLSVSVAAGASDGGSALTEYRIFDGADDALLATITLPATTGTINGLTNGVEVQLYARAVNAVGESEISNLVTGTPVAPVAPSAGQLSFVRLVLGIGG